MGRANKQLARPMSSVSSWIEIGLSQVGKVSKQLARPTSSVSSWDEVEQVINKQKMFSPESGKREIIFMEIHASTAYCRVYYNGFWKTFYLKVSTFSPRMAENRALTMLCRDLLFYT